MRGRAAADWGIKVAAVCARAEAARGGRVAALRRHRQPEHELLKNCSQRSIPPVAPSAARAHLTYKLEDATTS